MKRFVATICALLAALALTVPAQAHRQKVAISIVSNNPRTDMLEVVHQVPLHDAEHALIAQGIKAPDIIKDIESRRAFATYVAARFSVTFDGKPIDLTLLGSEVEGGQLLVYQEAPSPGPNARLIVQSQMLTDVWSKQVNRVNFGAGTKVETLVFRAGDPAKTAILP